MFTAEDLLKSYTEEQLQFELSQARRAQNTADRLCRPSSMRNAVRRERRVLAEIARRSKGA